MIENINKYLDNNWHILLLGILLFPFYCFFLGSVGFLFGLSLSKWHALIALILMISSVCILSADKKSRIINISLSLFALAIFIVIGSFHDDFQWDTMSYHKPAAYFMADGWNPVWQENLETYCDEHNIKWWWHLTHAHYFPNGQWTFNAICYLISGNINLGDFNNLIWAIAVFVISYMAFTRAWNLSWKWTLPFSFIMACNPIVIALINAGQIDGMLSCTLIVFLLSCTAWIKTGCKYWIYFILISAVFGVNLKFTALVYFSIAGFIQSLPLIYKYILHLIKKSESVQHGMITFKQWLIVVVLTSVAIVLTGVHPYITNTYHYSSPFYFLHSFNPEKYPTVNIIPLTGGYQNTNKFQRFWQTYINGVEGTYNENQNVETIPVTNITLYRNQNGNPFGKIWIIAFVLSVSFAIIFVTDCNDILLLLAILLTVLVQPHLWWVRFVPQFWYFPFIIFAITLCSEKRPVIHNRIAWLFAALIIGFLPMNLYDIAKQALNSVRSLQHERNFIEYLKERNDGSLLVVYFETRSDKYEINKYSIGTFYYFPGRWLTEMGIDNLPHVVDDQSNDKVDLLLAAKALINSRTSGNSFFYFPPNANKRLNSIDELQDSSKNQNVINNLAWLAKIRLHQLYNAWFVSN